MQESYAIESLTRRATSYFDRASFSAPVFLDADHVVFLDDRSGTKQASMVDITTGAISEITSSDERLLSLGASGGRIAYGTDIGGNEREQLYILMSPDSPPLRLTHSDEAINGLGPMTAGGDYILYHSNARDASVFDIVGISAEGGTPEIWLQDGGQVHPLAITADDTKAIIQKLNGNLDGDLLLLERGKDPVNLTVHRGEQWVSEAAFTRDEQGMWYLSNLDEEYVSLRHMDIKTKEGSIIFQADNWDVATFAVSGNGNHIAVAVNDGGASRLSILDSDGTGQIQVDLPDGVIDQINWSPDSSRFAFGFSTVEQPSAIYLCDLSGELTVVAQVEESAPPTFAPEVIHFNTFDGRMIPAFWFKPEGDGPFPVLVDIHGGPEGQRVLNYSPSGPVLQYLTSLGMGVLSLNVRGSTGYGKAYSHLDDKGLRLDSVADVAHAVEWLRSREDVDADRIAVYGRSYGGFMTLASLVFYPDLWAAGVDVVGIANFVSFLERTGPWRRKHREAEYGELEHDREMLERISPINHIENIRVPLMVCHGRNDPRVPLFEAEQVVEAVRGKGLDVVFKVYDDEGHALSKRKNEIDAFVTMGDFLQMHLDLPVQPDI